MNTLKKLETGGNKNAVPPFSRLTKPAKGREVQAAECLPISWPTMAEIDTSQLPPGEDGEAARRRSLRHSRYAAYRSWQRDALRVINAKGKPSLAQMIVAIRECIHWETGLVKASANHLAEEAGGISERTAQRHLKDLAEMGLTQNRTFKHPEYGTLRELRLARPTSYDLEELVEAAANKRAERAQRAVETAIERGKRPVSGGAIVPPSAPGTYDENDPECIPF